MKNRTDVDDVLDGHEQCKVCILGDEGNCEYWVYKDNTWREMTIKYSNVSECRRIKGDKEKIGNGGHLFQR